MPTASAKPPVWTRFWRARMDEGKLLELLAVHSEKRPDRTPGGVDGPCWIWTGYIGQDGYGRVKWNGKPERVHRIVAKLLKRPQGNTKFVARHMCHNKACVSPAH